jgi:glycosyltransferase involved in cell wall biosynthesis
VIRNPIRNDLFPPEADFDKAAFRAAHGLEPKAVVLLFAALGHFERKGLGLLIEALERVGPHVQVLVVGGEPGEIGSYKKMATSRGFSSQVHFQGFQADMRPWFWCADGFVLPSSYEACPLVALEAASAHLPLITTRLSGVEDFVQDKKNAFVVDRDVAALAAAIVDLAGLPVEQRQRMGVEAATAVRCYSEANFIEAWQQVFASLLSVKPA